MRERDGDVGVVDSEVSRGEVVWRRGGDVDECEEVDWERKSGDWERGGEMGCGDVVAVVEM